MARAISKVAPGWWDYTTLDPEILADAAKIDEKGLEQLSRPGFQTHFYDTIEEFYLAEALEYIDAWKEATASQPAGICGPIGPTEQLPLVALIVNALDIKLEHAHFWGMDEWVIDGREVKEDHPLSFARADRELCFNRIRSDLRMPESNIHFPSTKSADYERSFDEIRCVEIILVGITDIEFHYLVSLLLKFRGRYDHVPDGIFDIK